MFRNLALAAAVLHLALVTACAVNPATGKSQISLFAASEKEEIDLGGRAFPQVQQQMGGEYPDAALNRYVAQVGSRIAATSERPALPWTFAVVNDSSPNAFALPGGYVAITRGLLVSLENEAQLAAVLGHEIGHVTARHSVQGMQRSTFLNLGLAVLAGATGDAGYGALAQQAGALAATILDKSYSRDQEREADRFGIDYMVRAGYDPQGAVQLQEFFFRQLEGGNKGQWLEAMFRTHPFSSERLANVRAYIGERHAAASGNRAYRSNGKNFLVATARLRKTAKAYQLRDEAEALLKSGKDPRQAVVLYLQAAAAAPDEALIQAGLGMAYIAADDLTAARLYLGAALRLDSRYYLPHLGLGYVELQKGETVRAVTELETANKLLPTVLGTYLLGEGYEKSGRSADAVRQYRAVAEADPKGKHGKAARERLTALGQP